MISIICNLIRLLTSLSCSKYVTSFKIIFKQYPLSILLKDLTDKGREVEIFLDKGWRAFWLVSCTYCFQGWVCYFEKVIVTLKITFKQWIVVQNTHNILFCLDVVCTTLQSLEIKSKQTLHNLSLLFFVNIQWPYCGMQDCIILPYLLSYTDLLNRNFNNFDPKIFKLQQMIQLHHRILIIHTYYLKIRHTENIFRTSVKVIQRRAAAGVFSSALYLKLQLKYSDNEKIGQDVRF